jgi:hypothetical protein
MKRNRSLPRVGGERGGRPTPEYMYAVRVTTHQLSHLSHEAVVFQKHDRKNRRIYSADVGHYTSESEAQTKAASYQDKGMVVEIILRKGSSNNASQAEKVLSRRTRSSHAVTYENVGRFLLSRAIRLFQQHIGKLSFLAGFVLLATEEMDVMVDESLAVGLGLLIAYRTSKYTGRVKEPA